MRVHASRYALLSLCSIFALLICLALVTAGCGGGGGPTLASSTQPAATAPAASQPAPGASSTGSGSGSGGSGSGGTSGGGSSGGSGSTTSALAYVAGHNSFYGIHVDSSSNISMVSGSPYSVSGSATSFATDGNLLFVVVEASDLSGSSVNIYRADANGALTRLGSTPMQGGVGNAGLAVDSTGSFLYATGDVPPNNSPGLFGFAISQSAGTIAALPGSPYALNGAMGPASTPAVTPNGTWVCVGMELARTNQGVFCYPRHADGSVDGTNDISPNSSDTGVQELALTADSMHVLFTNGGGNQVISAAISANNNKAGPVASSGGSLSDGITIDPTGHWAVVSNFDSGNLALFAIAADGSLTQAGGAIATGSHPVGIAFSRSGNIFFAATGGGTVVYSFNPSTGAATQLNLSNPAPGNGGMIAAM